MTPYEAINGTVKPLILPAVQNNHEQNNVQAIERKISMNLIKSKDKMERKFNKFKRNRKLDLNSKVFVKVQNDKNKLKPIYDGPFTAVEICNSGVSYIL